MPRKLIADDISTHALHAHDIGRRILRAPLAEIAGLAVELRTCADDLKTCADRAEVARDTRETMSWGEGGPG